MPSAEYMREYRKEHPDYVEKNRDQARARAAARYDAYISEHGHSPRQRYSSRATVAARKPFVGVDGEGATLGKLHRYVLLRIGADVLMDDAGLGWQDCLEFISSRDPDFTYVSFAFDYDVTMILRQAGWGRNQELVKKGMCWYGEYLVEYRPHAKLRVTKMAKGEDERWHPVRHGITIHDTFKLFQTAFMNVINTWEALTPESRAVIADGKVRRVECDHLDDEMIRYNHLECDALVDVMTKVKAACDDAKLRPTCWEGPGYLATALLRRNRVPRRDDYIASWPELVQYAGRASMYGGRFEPVWIGPVGVATEIDINSAYPAAMLDMPCVTHAHWTRDRTPTVSTGYAAPRLLKVHVTPDFQKPRPSLFGLPYRTRQGRVVWPGEVRGWYWEFEVAQALHQKVEVLDGWRWTSDCDCPPIFEYNRELYEYRKTLPALQGWPFKLALNSQYGKLAQTVGHPVYSNHVLSSFITAHCRARIMEVIHHVEQCRSRPNIRCGTEVVAIATDAVFFKGRPDFGGLPMGEALGAYSELQLTEFFHVASGIYFSAEEPPKTRGVPRALVRAHEAEIKEAYRSMIAGKDLNLGVARLPYTRFVGLREAVARGHPGQLGSFVRLGGERGRAISYDWSSKRAPGLPYRDQPNDDPNLPVLTVPYVKHYQGIDTTPYGKVVPGCYDQTPESETYNDTPDWISPTLPYPTGE